MFARGKGTAGEGRPSQHTKPRSTTRRQMRAEGGRQQGEESGGGSERTAGRRVAMSWGAELGCPPVCGWTRIGIGSRFADLWVGIRFDPSFLVRLPSRCTRSDRVWMMGRLGREEQGGLPRRRSRRGFFPLSCSLRARLGFCTLLSLSLSAFRCPVASSLLILNFRSSLLRCLLLRFATRLLR